MRFLLTVSSAFSFYKRLLLFLVTIEKHVAQRLQSLFLV